MRTFHQFLTEDDDDRIDPARISLSAVYDDLNARLFGDVLPDIPTVFGKVPKGASGVTRYTVTGPQRVTKPETIAMTIAPAPYRRDLFYGIVAHEMVHVWVAHTNHTERDGHGMWFQAQRAKAQALADFPIPAKDVVLDDDERDAAGAQPVTFIAGAKKDGVEVISLFGRRALDRADQRAQAAIHCTDMVGRLGFRWAEYGSAVTTLAGSMTVQRGMKARASQMTFYRSEVRHLQQVNVLGTYGTR